MHWFRVEAQRLRKEEKATLDRTQTEFAEQRESLRRSALIITGNEVLAEQSIIDAAGLANTDNRAFRKWLVQWGDLATARVAIHAVRTSIRETSAQYATWNCSHGKHKPLSSVERDSFRELDAQTTIQQLDVLARAVFVLHGCQGLSLLECVDLLNVPLPSATGAYCKAQDWFREITKSRERLRRPSSPLLRLVRHDPDGVPVWASKWSEGLR